MMIMINSVLLVVFTILSVVSLGSILWGVNPYTATSAIKALFFITLFFSATGIFSLLNLWLARMVKNPTRLDRCLQRGILLAMLVVAIVALETASLLNMFNASALLVLVIALEVVAIYRRNHARYKTN